MRSSSESYAARDRLPAVVASVCEDSSCQSTRQIVCERVLHRRHCRYCQQSGFSHLPTHTIKQERLDVFHIGQAFMEAHTLDKKQQQLLRRDRIEVLGIVLYVWTDHALDKLACVYLLIHPGIVQSLELFVSDLFQPCQDDIVEKNVCRWIMRLRDRHPILDHSIIPSLLRYLIQIDTITRINELPLLGRRQKRVTVA